MVARLWAWVWILGPCKLNPPSPHIKSSIGCYVRLHRSHSAIVCTLFAVTLFMWCRTLPTISLMIMICLTRRTTQVENVICLVFYISSDLAWDLILSNKEAVVSSAIYMHLSHLGTDENQLLRSYRVMEVDFWWAHRVRRTRSSHVPMWTKYPWKGLRHCLFYLRLIRSSVCLLSVEACAPCMLCRLNTIHLCSTAGASCCPRPCPSPSTSGKETYTHIIPSHFCPAAAA